MDNRIKLVKAVLHAIISTVTAPLLASAILLFSISVVPYALYDVHRSLGWGYMHVVDACMNDSVCHFAVPAMLTLVIFCDLVRAGMPEHTWKLIAFPFTIVRAVWTRARACMSEIEEALEAFLELDAR